MWVTICISQAQSSPPSSGFYIHLFLLDIFTWISNRHPNSTRIKLKSTPHLFHLQPSPSQMMAAPFPQLFRPKTWKYIQNVFRIPPCQLSPWLPLWSNQTIISCQDYSSSPVTDLCIKSLLLQSFLNTEATVTLFKCCVSILLFLSKLCSGSMFYWE